MSEHPWLTLIFACGLLLILGQIRMELSGIQGEMDRRNDIECIRLDYEGVDSLGPRDYEACG